MIIRANDPELPNLVEIDIVAARDP